MAAINKSPTPAGMNVMALVVIVALLAVAFGCWVDDEIRRHVQHHAASHAHVVAPDLSGWLTGLEPATSRITT